MTASQYNKNSPFYETTRRLSELGVDVYEPRTRFEENIAHVLEEFSSYVLFTAKENCLRVLEKDLLNNGGSVGELQGGTLTNSIYRVSFPSDGGEVSSPDHTKCNNVATKLLCDFNQYNQQMKRHDQVILTIEKIKQYMLAMCNRRSSERNCIQYTALENLMFILCFGNAVGQVRHIDNMLPNLQICLYMSKSCPSTIVYDMEDGSPVIDGTSLVAFWRSQNKAVPALISEVLQVCGDRKLKNKWYTRYFGFWHTMNSHLTCFGKLYQPVTRQLSLETDPGTTLLAGGNEVHAGPPTTGPRMFAFAVGIPDDVCDESLEQSGSNGNEGEVQYSPVLLHLDLCCLLFGLLDYEYATSNSESSTDAKFFLVDVLVELIRECPSAGYLRQIDEERVGVRKWVENVLRLIEERGSTTLAVDDAILSREIFYSPDVVKRNLKKKKGRLK